MDELVLALRADSLRHEYPTLPPAIKRRYQDTACVIFKASAGETKNYLSFGTRRSSFLSQFGNTPVLLRRSVSSSGSIVSVAEQWIADKRRSFSTLFEHSTSGVLNGSNSGTTHGVDHKSKENHIHNSNCCNNAYGFDDEGQENHVFDNSSSRIHRGSCKRKTNLVSGSCGSSTQGLSNENIDDDICSGSSAEAFSSEGKDISVLENVAKHNLKVATDDRITKEGEQDDQDCGIEQRLQASSVQDGGTPGILLEEEYKRNGKEGHNRTVSKNKGNQVEAVQCVEIKKHEVKAGKQKEPKESYEKSKRIDSSEKEKENQNSLDSEIRKENWKSLSQYDILPKRRSPSGEVMRNSESCHVTKIDLDEQGTHPEFNLKKSQVNVEVHQKESHLDLDEHYKQELIIIEEGDVCDENSEEKVSGNVCDIWKASSDFASSALKSATNDANDNFSSPSSRYIPSSSPHSPSTSSHIQPCSSPSRIVRLPHIAVANMAKYGAVSQEIFTLTSPLSPSTDEEEFVPEKDETSDLHRIRSLPDIGGSSLHRNYSTSSDNKELSKEDACDGGSVLLGDENDRKKELKLDNIQTGEEKKEGKEKPREVVEDSDSGMDCNRTGKENTEKTLPLIKYLGTNKGNNEDSLKSSFGGDQVSFPRVHDFASGPPGHRSVSPSGSTLSGKPPMGPSSSVRSKSTNSMSRVGIVSHGQEEGNMAVHSREEGHMVLKEGVTRRVGKRRSGMLGNTKSSEFIIIHPDDESESLGLAPISPGACHLNSSSSTPSSQPSSSSTPTSTTPTHPSPSTLALATVKAHISGLVQKQHTSSSKTRSSSTLYQFSSRSFDLEDKKRTRSLLHEWTYSSLRKNRKEVDVHTKSHKIRKKELGTHREERQQEKETQVAESPELKNETAESQQQLHKVLGAESVHQQTAESQLLAQTAKLQQQSESQVTEEQHLTCHRNEQLKHQRSEEEEMECSRQINSTVSQMVTNQSDDDDMQVVAYNVLMAGEGVTSKLCSLM